MAHQMEAASKPSVPASADRYWRLAVQIATGRVRSGTAPSTALTDAISFARASGLEIAVRGGGHSYACNSSLMAFESSCEGTDRYDRKTLRRL